MPDESPQSLETNTAREETETIETKAGNRYILTTTRFSPIQSTWQISATNPDTSIVMSIIPGTRPDKVEIQFSKKDGQFIGDGTAQEILNLDTTAGKDAITKKLEPVIDNFLSKDLSTQELAQASQSEDPSDSIWELLHQPVKSSTPEDEDQLTMYGLSKDKPITLAINEYTQSPIARAVNKGLNIDGNRSPVVMNLIYSNGHIEVSFRALDGVTPGGKPIPFPREDADAETVHTFFLKTFVQKEESESFSEPDSMADKLTFLADNCGEYLKDFTTLPDWKYKNGSDLLEAIFGQKILERDDEIRDEDGPSFVNFIRESRGE